MPNDEARIEQMIQDNEAEAPRLTPDQIDAKIIKTYYHVVPGTVLTICVLTLENGFTVTGESAPVSAVNFNEEIGQKIAFENARNKIWQLEGYLLRDRLHSELIQKVARGEGVRLSECYGHESLKMLSQVAKGRTLHAEIAMKEQTNG